MGAVIDEEHHIDQRTNDIILYSYKLAKRKEEALKKLKDTNIKIFMGEDDQDLSNMQSIHDQMKRF